MSSIISVGQRLQQLQDELSAEPVQRRFSYYAQAIERIASTITEPEDFNRTYALLYQLKKKRNAFPLTDETTLCAQEITRLNTKRLKRAKLSILQAELTMFNNDITVRGRKGEIIQKILEIFNKGSQSLDITNSMVTRIPNCVGQLTRISNLELSYNQLLYLPKEIGNLTRLRFLILEKNQLSFLPDEIGNLAQLRRLNLRYNPFLCELPSTLGRIQTLIFVEIEGTQIPEESRDTILNQCTTLRDKGSA